MFQDAPEYDSKTKPPLIIAEQPVGPANNCTDGTVTDFLPFPSSAELNGRFRKLITLYQRTSKVTLAKEESKAKVNKMLRQRIFVSFLKN